VLRVETTVNDVSFFKHHRKVEHRGSAATRELAPLKETIYSLIDLREILLGCNLRYLAFLSSLDDPSAGERDLQRLPVWEPSRRSTGDALDKFNRVRRQPGLLARIDLRTIVHELTSLAYVSILPPPP
jgi:hypothetical protein